MFPELLVPILICLGLFALIFGVVYLKSRENMALIERGFNPKEGVAQPRPFINLKYGMLLLGAGLGLFVAYLVDVVWLGHKVIMERGSSTNEHWSMINDTGEPIIYFALVAIGGGLGLILSYRIEKKQWLDKQIVNG